MTKAELVSKVAECAGLKKADAEKAVSAVFATIAESMKTEKVSIVGFGSFSTKVRPARTAKNPATGATIEVPAKKVPQFSAGKALKDEIAK